MEYLKDVLPGACCCVFMVIQRNVHLHVDFLQPGRVFFFPFIILGCLCLHALTILRQKRVVMQHMAFYEEAWR